MWVCLMKDHLFFFLNRVWQPEISALWRQSGEDQELGASLDYWRGIGDRRRVDK